MDCHDVRWFVEAILKEPHFTDEGERDDFQKACDHALNCRCEDCRLTVDQLAGFQTAMAVA